jgi:hypothetical protein
MDLGWYDYGFRDYDPQIGRFPQLDPLADDYPELTPYQYASCDPVTNIDVDGLEGTSAIGAAAKAAEQWHQLENVTVIALRKIGATAPQIAKVKQIFEVTERVVNLITKVNTLQVGSGKVAAATAVAGSGVKVMTEDAGSAMEVDKTGALIETEVEESLVPTLGAGLMTVAGVLMPLKAGGDGDPDGAISRRTKEFLERKHEEELYEREPKEIQYRLIATKSGEFPKLNRGDSRDFFRKGIIKNTGPLKKGDTWKIGTTGVGKKRYSEAWLKRHHLRQVDQFRGTKEEVELVELLKIFVHQITHGGEKPYGNTKYR